MKPAVTVIVPAFNASKFLTQTIQSVIEQTVQEWELVIVDDGSTDVTSEIVHSYELIDNRIRGITQVNRGQSSARNRGMANSNSAAEFIVFLDSDDVWDEDALEKLLLTLDEHPEAVASYGLGRYIDQTGRKILIGACEEQCRPRPTYSNGRVTPLQLTEPTSFATFVTAPCIITPGVVLIRRESIRRVGEFDTSLKQCEDWDMFIRLARFGPFQFRNEAILGYRRHGQNLSQNRAEEREMMRQVLKKAIRSPDNNSEQQYVVDHCYRPAQLYFMKEKIKLAQSCLTQGDLRGTVNQLPPIARRAMALLMGSPT